ncbi:unnamed protein product, partial [Polarella glacialis]
MQLVPSAAAPASWHCRASCQASRALPNNNNSSINRAFSLRGLLRGAGSADQLAGVLGVACGVAFARRPRHSRRPALSVTQQVSTAAEWEAALRLVE